MPRNGFIYKLFVLIFIVLFTTGNSCSGGQESETAITETETSESVTETETSESATETETSEGATETETSESATETETSEGATETETSEGATETETSESATETETSEKNSEASSAWLKILVFALVFISIVVVAILALFDVEKNEKSFPYSLKRKKPHQQNPVSKNDTKPGAVAADNAPEVKPPSSDIDGHISQQTQNINELRRELAGLLKNIDDMNQTFMTLKTNLDQKDEEISRYKNGYDAIIFKNFLLRFTRVDKVIREYINEDKIDINGLKDIQIQMDDALSECDVETFSPKIGDNFKTSLGVADNPDIIETSNESEDSKIAEVLKPGYRRKLPNTSSEDYQIITEAKVVIYVYKKLKK